MSKKIISIFFIIVLFISNVQSAKIIPVSNISLMAGQYFFKSLSGSPGGNLNFYYTPVINFSQQTALLPMISFNYRGTKDVQELAGGGTLTQEYMDTGLLIKYITKFSNSSKIKTKIGYKSMFLKETKDEVWQKGLFDSNRLIYGVEIEKLQQKGNIAFGMDFYKMKYPNYNSLVSMYSTSTIDAEIYQEISKNAGKNTMDYDTVELFIEFKRKTNDIFSYKINYDVSEKYFTDQKVIMGDDRFSTEKRKDQVHILTGSMNYKIKEDNDITCSYNIMNYLSNQNSYNATTFRFIPNFYEFVQHNITPSMTLKISKNSPVDLFVDMGYRIYKERLAQKTDGTYKENEKIYQMTMTVGGSICFPVKVIKNLITRFSLNYRNVTSNMEFEGYYKYNYYVYNYFLGLEWSR